MKTVITVSETVDGLEFSNSIALDEEECTFSNSLHCARACAENKLRKAIAEHKAAKSEKPVWDWRPMSELPKRNGLYLVVWSSIKCLEVFNAGKWRGNVSGAVAWCKIERPKNE